MNENKQNISSNLAKAKAYEITAEEYIEIPELDDDFFNKADFLMSKSCYLASDKRQLSKKLRLVKYLS